MRVGYPFLDAATNMYIVCLSEVGKDDARKINKVLDDCFAQKLDVRIVKNDLGIAYVLFYTKDYSKFEEIFKTRIGLNFPELSQPLRAKL